MFLVLTDEILNVTTAEHYSALECIFKATHFGIHYVYCSRTVADFLYTQEQQFTRLSFGVIKQVRNELTQSRQIFERITTKIFIDLSASGFINSNDGTWRVHLLNFEAHELSHKTLLVCEDVTDGKILIRAAECHQINIGLKSVMCISADLRHGGGGSIGIVLNYIIENEKKICICIVDSDKKSPDSALGGTALSCKKVADKSKHLLKLIILDSRELENVVPFRISIEALTSNNTNHDNFIFYTDNAAFHEMLQYCDFKNGTCLNWVRSLPENSHERNYWDGILTLITAHGFSIDESTNKSCDDGCKISTGQCNWKFFHSLPDRILRRIDELPLSSHKFAELCKSSQNNAEWLRLGQHVFEWACGKKPSRI